MAAAFQYYFDVRFIQQEFDSYYSKSLFKSPVENIKKSSFEKTKIIVKKEKYIPQIMDASLVEFKKTKFSNNKKRKHK